MSGVVDLFRRYERGRRFWRLVDVEGRDDCWPWHGPTDRAGNGRFGRRPAHEHAYELMVGPLAPDTTLEHSCGNPRCVNPDHLRSHAES